MKGNQGTNKRVIERGAADVCGASWQKIQEADARNLAANAISRALHATMEFFNTCEAAGTVEVIVFPDEGTGLKTQNSQFWYKTLFWIAEAGGSSRQVRDRTNTSPRLTTNRRCKDRRQEPEQMKREGIRECNEERYDTIVAVG